MTIAPGSLAIVFSAVLFAMGQPVSGNGPYALKESRRDEPKDKNRRQSPNSTVPDDNASIEKARALVQQSELKEAIVIFEEILSRRKGASQSTAALQRELAGLYSALKDYRKAIELLEAARATFRANKGWQSKDYLRTLQDLFGVLMDANDVAGTVPVLLDICELQRGTTGKDRLSYATTLHGLASAYVQLDALPHATKALNEALAIYEEINGRKHLSSVAILCRLALVYHKQRLIQQAEKCYLEVLDYFKLNKDDSNSDVYSTALRGIARLYKDNQRVPESIPVWEEVLGIEKRKAGDTAPGYLATLNDLADAYSSVASYSKAEPLYRQLSDLRRRLLGDKHKDYLAAQVKLAVLYKTMKEYDKAEKILVATYTVQKETCGPDDLSRFLTLSHLGNLYRETNRIAKAESVFEEFLDLATRNKHNQADVRAIAVAALGEIHLAMKDYPNAERLLKDAQELRGKINGLASLEYAQCAHRLGLLYLEMGRLGDAELLLTQAVDLRQRLLKPEDEVYIGTIRNLAELYRRTNQLSKAKDILKSSYEARERACGINDLLSMLVLRDLANIEYLNGNSDNAIRLCEQVLLVYQKLLPDTDPSVVATLRSLAGFYSVAGKNDDTLRVLLRLQTIVMHKNGKRRVTYALTLIDLGEAYARCGDSRKAEVVLLEALEIIKEQEGPESINYAKAMQALGSLHTSARKLQDAERELSVARDIIEKKGEANSSELRSNMRARASLSIVVGDNAKAAELLNQAQMMEAEAGLHAYEVMRWTIVMSMAERHQKLGEYQQALPLCKEALELTKKEVGENSHPYVTGLWTLADVYRGLGEIGEEELCLERAVRLVQSSWGKDHPLYGLGLHLLATHHLEMGELREAEELFTQAKAAYERVNVGVKDASSGAEVYKLGLIAFLREDFVKAASLFQEAWETRIAHVAATLPALSEAEALAYLAEGPSAIGRDQYLSALKKLQTRNAEAAYEPVWKSRGLIERMLSRRRKYVAISPEAKARNRELLAVSRELAGLVYSIPKPEERHARAERLKALNERKEQLQRELFAIDPAFFGSELSHTATLGECIRLLPVDVGLVDITRVTIWEPPLKGGSYPRAEDHYEAFVCRRTGPERYSINWVHLGPANAIDEAVNRWTTEIEKEAYLRWARSPQEGSGQLLRKLIWEKVRADLEGCSTVLIIPDGQVSRIPWAALPGAELGKFLVEECNVGTISSGQRLYEVLSTPQRPKGKGLLLVGGLDYGQPESTASKPVDQAGLIWDPLPKTGELVRAIGRLGKNFGPAYLQGDGATKESLSSELPGKEIVVLATHGFFASPQYRVQSRHEIAGEQLYRPLWSATPAYATVTARSPLLLSGVVLSGANRRSAVNSPLVSLAENGILTAEEVVATDLRDAHLVILSACETALGTEHPGEGVFGLQQAFQLAGARSVVASLWKVETNATTMLMERFCENMWNPSGSQVKPLPKLKALCEAQRSLIRCDIVDRGPLQGGGTIHKGDPKALKKASESLKSGEKLVPPFYWAAFTLSGDWR